MQSISFHLLLTLLWVALTGVFCQCFVSSTAAILSSYIRAAHLIWREVQVRTWVCWHQGKQKPGCSLKEECLLSTVLKHLRAAVLQIWLHYKFSFLREDFFFPPFKITQLWKAMQDHLEPTDKCCCATATPSQVTTSNCSNLLTLCIAQKQPSVSFVLVHSSTCHI